MPQPFVSVIIPTFNRALLLERALRSVHSQSFPNFEVIVVDDGSTDNSKAIVEDLCHKLSPHQSWSYHFQNNGGVSSARNLGAALARGKWLAFLDSDDEWLPEKLHVQMDYLEAKPELEFVFSDEIWLRNGLRVNPKKKHQKSGGRVFFAAVQECFIGCSTVVIQKEFFKNCGGFREDFPVCEDYDLWLKIAAEHVVGFIDEPLVVRHGGRTDQLSTMHKCMDYYRVLALDDILDKKCLSADEQIFARGILSKKCNILLKGYKKHGNGQDEAQIFALLKKWT